MIRAFLFLLLAGGAVAYTRWVYTRLELPVRGGRLLAGLRMAALVLILALLFDPQVPWGDPSGARTRWALLDASASMTALGPDGTAPWESARVRARALEAEGWTLVAFGDGVAEDTAIADGVRTTLAPALERAVEAGAGQIRVLSDVRLHDPVEVGVLLEAGAATVYFETFGSAGVNGGVAALRVADAPRRGEPVPAEVELFSEGVTGALVLEVREEDRLVHSDTVEAPPPGLRRRVEVELPPPQAEGRVRYTARVVVPDDGYPDDDEAVWYATAGYEEGAVVLVSLAPDWEPRWLLPVMEEVTGLPGAGYIRVAPDRFMPMGRATERGPTVDSATVRRAAGDAVLLVVHGLAGDADPWAAALVARAGRVVAWPVDARAAERLGLAVTPPRRGEWYAAQDVASSPLAGDLAGARLQGLPPLTDLMVLGGDRIGAESLLVQLGGTGRGEAALVLTRPGGRRVAVPLARGFWRWSARGGDARDAYRRVWSGVAGWLLAPDPDVTTPDVRPVAWVVGRGMDVRWSVPDTGATRIEVLGSGGVVSDTTITERGTVSTGVLPPGTYSYRATDDAGVVRGEGRFDVARATTEMLPPGAVPEASDGGEPSRGLSASGAGRPLRTSPLPYLFLLLLLSAEWIGRRRAGLR